jgi:hypothetical protein
MTKLRGAFRNDGKEPKKCLNEVTPTLQDSHTDTVNTHIYDQWKASGNKCVLRLQEVFQQKSYMLDVKSRESLLNKISDSSFDRWAGIAQPVLRLTTGWTVRGSNPGGGEIFPHVQTCPGTHPASCTMGTASFPGVKRPELCADHPPPSSAEVENE